LGEKKKKKKPHWEIHGERHSVEEGLPSLGPRKEKPFGKLHKRKVKKNSKAP